MEINNVKDLAKLLDYGAECFKQHKINVAKLRGARKIFFPMIVAAQNYTESIYCLCKENRTPVCLGILRSLTENLIKAKFLYCHPLRHCHVIFFNGVKEKRKQQNHALEFLNTNPEYLTQALTIKDLSIALKKVKIQEKRTQLKIDSFSSDKVSDDILEMAKYVDKHHKNKNKKSYSLEWIYISLFRHLSSGTHINFLHFEQFFKIEGNEIVVLLSGNPDDVEEIVSLATYLYKEMLEMFLRVFKIPLIKKLKKISS